MSWIWEGDAPQPARMTEAAGTARRPSARGYVAKLIFLLLFTWVILRAMAATAPGPAPANVECPGAGHAVPGYGTHKTLQMVPRSTTIPG
jgi:hypothetical protein